MDTDLAAVEARVTILLDFRAGPFLAVTIAAADVDAGHGCCDGGEVVEFLLLGEGILIPIGWCS